MKKRFNLTGTGIPGKHYIVDISEKLKNMLQLVYNKEYFIINRARQYETLQYYIKNKWEEKICLIF